MRVLEGFEQLADLFVDLAVAAPLAVASSKVIAANAVKEKVEAIYGDASKLASLSDATQVDRATHGYSQNNPLLRTGELLKDSVGIEHPDPETAIVGSDEMIHLYHELGYLNARTGQHVPARPVFHIAAAESEELVALIVDKDLSEMFVTVLGE